MRLTQSCDLLSWNGTIFRPSQNGSEGYGFAISINKIITLNESEYEEEVVDNIKPNWNDKITGIHTINFDGAITVIDAKFRRFRFVTTVYRIWYEFKACWTH